MLNYTVKYNNMRLPPRLPSEYLEVEYIQSSGTQYIDTGFTPNNNSRIDIDFQYTSTSSGRLVGSESISTSPLNAFRMGTGNGGTQWLAGYYQPLAQINPLTSLTERHLLSLNKNIFKVDNYTTYTFSSATFSCLYTAYIFMVHSNSMADNAIGKLYGCTIWDNEEIVRDYIPCYRKSDGVIGLYDLVNNVFYTNSGTGTFLMGRPINALPDEYIEVEYIESTGTQTIDSGLDVRDTYYNTFRCLCDIEFTSTVGTNYCGTGNHYFGGIIANNTTYLYGPTTNGGGYNTSTVPLLSRHQIDYDLYNKLFKIDGTTLYSSMGAFDRGQAGNFEFSRTGTSMKIYFILCFLSGNISRIYIPCYNKTTKVIGLYDIVNNQFYTNSGTGEFLKGNDIDYEYIYTSPEPVASVPIKYNNETKATLTTPTTIILPTKDKYCNSNILIGNIILPTNGKCGRDNVKVITKTAKLYLYNYGDECSALTNGWSSSNYTATAPIVSGTKESTDFYFAGTSSKHTILGTNNMIDLTGYTTLKAHLNIIATSSGYWNHNIRILSGRHLTDDRIISWNASSLGDLIASIDISNINLHVYIVNECGGMTDYKYYVYEIWLE